jgi:cytochrome c biogenesis protein CcmG, thiol:disulfide interchange protein DsbE
MVRALIAVIAWAICFASPAFALERGDTAPSVSLPGIDGTVSVAPRTGRWLYVDFWASWCAPCKRSFPWMNSMHSKYAARGLDVVAINVDQRRSDADRFLKATPAQFVIAFDPAGDVPKRFNVKAMPSAYLIDPQGRVRFVHRGFNESDAEVLEREIAKFIEGK